MSLLRAGIQAQESLLKKDPADNLLRGYLANSYTRLAQSLRFDDPASVEYFRKALGMRLALYEKAPENIANRAALAGCQTNLAQAIAVKRPADALQNYEKAIALLESVTAADPKNAAYRTQLAAAQTRAARIQHAH